MTKTIKTDHVARLIELRRRETPGMALDGMAIFARARRVDRLSRQWIEAVFERNGLDSGEFDVLASLQRAGPPYTARPTELFKTLMITSGGLTDRLDRLEKKRLVERLASDEDRRSLPVRLTSAGLKLIRSAYAEDMAIEQNLLSALSSTERAQLARLLMKLLVDLENRALPG
jgi:DNA-binding MarR family transcriptional regulator